MLPQPSGMFPQRPSHSIGLQAVHWLSSHFVPKPHALLHVNPFPQASVIMPHPLSPPQASDCVIHVLDVGLQIWPCTQVPHWRTCPQLSLTSPQVRPRLAQVTGKQPASDTARPPPSTIVPPLPAEVTPALPPVRVLLLEVIPPVPCTVGAASLGFVETVLPRLMRLP